MNLELNVPKIKAKDVCSVAKSTLVKVKISCVTHTNSNCVKVS